MPHGLHRILRFGLVGLLTTALTYGVFVLTIRAGLHYLLASALAWGAGVAVSFLLNKRFTFSLRSRADLREVASFVGGYGVQFLIATAGYAVLIGGVGLEPTPAFMINLVITSLFSFLFMRWVVFRAAVASSGTPG